MRTTSMVRLFWFATFLHFHTNFKTITASIKHQSKLKRRSTKYETNVEEQLVCKGLLSTCFLFY
jgi:hypothetical protein